MIYVLVDRYVMPCVCSKMEVFEGVDRAFHARAFIHQNESPTKVSFLIRRWGLK